MRLVKVSQTPVTRFLCWERGGRTRYLPGTCAGAVCTVTESGNSRICRIPSASTPLLSPSTPQPLNPCPPNACPSSKPRVISEWSAWRVLIVSTCARPIDPTALNPVWNRAAVAQPSSSRPRATAVWENDRRVDGFDVGLGIVQRFEVV